MINFKHLYVMLYNNLNDRLYGELTFVDNNTTVVWSFDSDMTLRTLNDMSIVDENEVEIFSAEEKLMEIYKHDISIIKNYIGDMEQSVTPIVMYTTPSIRGESVSFEFFEK
jgi:hypothetical protein